MFDVLISDNISMKYLHEILVYWNIRNNLLFETYCMKIIDKGFLDIISFHLQIAFNGLAVLVEEIITVNVS